MISFSASSIAEHLRLNPMLAKHVVYCPFHPDSGTKSLSVNLARGTFYCHGGCDEPKGGGAVAFEIKWARHKEGKTLTPEEARRRVRRSFRVPNAKTLSRQMMREELLLFAWERSNTYADIVKLIEREIAQIGHPRDDAAWETFAALHRDLTWYDYAFETCRSSLWRLRPELVTVFKEAKTRGEWDFEALRVARVRAEYRRREYALLREWEELRETTNACHPENPSTTPNQNPSPSRSSRRTPVPRRQPVTPPRRQPVTPPRRQPV